MMLWLFNFREGALNINELKVIVYCLDYKSIERYGVFIDKMAHFRD
jgi:hypothetical protein